MIWPVIAILGLVTLQRLAELGLARSNTRRLLARGAVEVAPGHYPAIVVLHASWLGALWLLAPGRPIVWALLAPFLLLQAARMWVIATLGARWTTRIIVVEAEPPIRSGPYRFLNHPNYWIVAGEIALLPLLFGLPLQALVFTVLNGALMVVRIRAENRALAR